MAIELNGYILSKAWFTFVAENRQMVKPTHTALFFWIAELWNRLGKPDSFGLPTSEVVHHTCINSHTTLSANINDLIEWGFLSVKHKSKNQYTANIITICLPKKWNTTSEAQAKHRESQHTKQLNGTGGITKYRNNDNKEYLNEIEYIRILEPLQFSSEIKNLLVVHFRNRLSKKQKLTGGAAKILIGKIVNWLKKYSDQEVQSAIEDAITNNWTGIFEPKVNNSQKPVKGKIETAIDTYNKGIEILRKERNGTID